EHLVVDADQPPAVEDGGGVGDPALPGVGGIAGLRRGVVDEADDGGDPPRPASQPAHGVDAGLDVGVAQHEVLRRVPAYGELRQHQDVGAFVFRPVHRLGDAALVAVDVTDDEVELGSSDT